MVDPLLKPKRVLLCADSNCGISAKFTQWVKCGCLWMDR
jgi:hypothetical protein